MLFAIGNISKQLSLGNCIPVYYLACLAYWILCFTIKSQIKSSQCTAPLQTVSSQSVLFMVSFVLDLFYLSFLLFFCEWEKCFSAQLKVCICVLFCFLIMGGLAVNTADMWWGWYGLVRWGHLFCYCVQQRSFAWSRTLGNLAVCNRVWLMFDTGTLRSYS